MLVTDKNKQYIRQAMEVDFLTEEWERIWYARALMRAAYWGRKIDQQQKEFKSKHRLIDKYNV